MMKALDSNLFLQSHELKLVGCKMGRNVTVVRLASGKTVIHSTATFEDKHLQEIRRIGEPAWLVEATNFHDTCAKSGRRVFPEIPYLVPPGFKGVPEVDTSQILPVPAEWSDELLVVEIEGMPKIREHVFFHIPTKTLIIADLLFNLPPDAGGWSRGFLRVTAGIREYPEMSRMFRFCIRDRAAFRKSIRKIADWNFERIIPGHGDPIEKNAHHHFCEIMKRHRLWQ